MNKAPIKILFIVNNLERRGAEQQLFGFVKMLSKIVDISVFRFSNSANEFPEFLEMKTISIFSNKYAGTYNIMKLLPLYHCVRKGHFDVIITLGMGASLFFGRICALLCGVKIVYSILNTFENFYNLPKRDGQYFDILNEGLNRIVPSVKKNRKFRFLPNSERLTEKIRRIVPSYSVKTLYNGISMEEMQDVYEHIPDKQIKLLADNINGFPVIVQVGSIDETKNQMFTLKCLNRISEDLPEVRYLVIGTGEKKEELMHKAAEYGLHDQVIYAGRMSRSNCLYLISMATILVLTSESESFPNVLVEAQTLALPVISNDVGGASEIIEHGVSGYLIQKGDEIDFIKRAVYLLKNEGPAREMGKRGKKRVLNLFSMTEKVNNVRTMIRADMNALYG